MPLFHCYRNLETTLVHWCRLWLQKFYWVPEIERVGKMEGFWRTKHCIGMCTLYSIVCTENIVCAAFSHTWGIYIASFPKTWGPLMKRRWKNAKSHSLRRARKKVSSRHVLMAAWAHGLTAAMVAWTRATQNQDCQHSRMKERGARELPPLTEELCTDDFRGEGESAFFRGTSPGILQGMLSDPSVYRLYDVNYDQHIFYVCMKFPKN